MTFVLLVFNAVTNVNNNLNNNNNNINDNNFNAVNQQSNNVQSTVNAANQIGVTILPIPGKRSLRNQVSWQRALRARCGDNDLNLAYALSSDIYARLLQVQTLKGHPCEEFKICEELQDIIESYGLEEAVNTDLHLQGHEPRMTKVDCLQHFPHCNDQ